MKKFSDDKHWGQGQFANMPKDAVMMEYSKENYGTDPRIDDTMVRLDSDARENARKGRRSPSEGMY